MATDIIHNDLHVDGSLSCRNFTPPASSVGNAAFKTGDLLSAEKQEHQFDLNYSQQPGSAVVAATHDLRIVNGANGKVVAISAAITGAIATGGDRTVTVDLQKGNTANPFATILTAPIAFSNADTLRAAKSATFSISDLVVGDILRLVITVAGAAGNQAQGLIVSTTVKEDPI